MGFMNEFKKFAIKGNVMDLAVGVIIGGAFNKIVTALVGSVIMPVISMIIGSTATKLCEIAGRPVLMVPRSDVGRSGGQAR